MGSKVNTNINMMNMLFDCNRHIINSLYEVKLHGLIGLFDVNIGNLVVPCICGHILYLSTYYMLFGADNYTISGIFFIRNRVFINYKSGIGCNVEELKNTVFIEYDNVIHIYNKRSGEELLELNVIEYDVGVVNHDVEFTFQKLEDKQRYVYTEKGEVLSAQEMLARYHRCKDLHNGFFQVWDSGGYTNYANSLGILQNGTWMLDRSLEESMRHVRTNRKNKTKTWKINYKCE